MEEEIDISTLAKGTTWSFIAQMMLKLFSFFYLIVLTKFFSTAEVGIFYFVLSIVSFISIFTDFGLNQSLPRYVPYLYGKGRAAILRPFMKIVFLIGGFFSLFFSLVLFFSAPFIASALGRPEITQTLQILAFLPFINELAGLGGGFLVGRKLIKNYQIVTNLQGITKLVFTLVLGFLIAFNSTSLSYAYLLSFIPLIIGFSYFMLKDLHSLPKKSGEEVVEHSLIKEVFYFGLILSIIMLFYVIASSTDRFMLGILGGERAMEKVGVYSVVSTFANLLLIPFTAILTIFFPMVSELFGRKKIKEIKKISIVGIKWSIIIGAPFFILLISFPNFLLRIFYGPEYAAADSVFILYLVSFAVLSITQLLLKVIAAMRRLDIELIIAGICAIVNIIFNWFFIPLWGMNGAAFATLLSFLLMGYLTYFYSKKLFDFDLPKDSIKLILISFSAFVLFSIPSAYIASLLSSLPLQQLAVLIGILDVSITEKLLKLVILGVLFLVVCTGYLGILIITSSFGKEEVAIAQRALRRLGVPKPYILKITRILSRRDRAI